MTKTKINKKRLIAVAGLAAVAAAGGLIAGIALASDKPSYQHVDNSKMLSVAAVHDAETVKRALDTLGYTKTSEIKVSEFEGFKDLLADLAEKIVEVEAEEAADELEKIGEEIEM